MKDNTSIELCETFVAESMDYIDELEPQFIELSQAMACNDAIAFQTLMNQIFRLIHTIKGSAGSLGFKVISALAHKAENMLDSIRHNRISLTPLRLNLLTRSLDVFRNLLSILQQRQTDQGCEAMITELATALDLANRDDAMDSTPTATLPAATELSSGFFVFDDDPIPPETQSSTASASIAPVPVSVDRQSSPKAAVEASQSEASVETPRPSTSGFKINPAMRHAFVQEGEENLSKVELCLLGFSEQSADVRSRSIGESLRILHSFKGNCGFMQLTDMEAIVHAMETVLQDMEKDTHDPRNEELLRATDTLKTYLGLVSIDAYSGIPELNSILSQLGVIPYSHSGAGTHPQTKAVQANAEAKPTSLAEVKTALEQMRSAGLDAGATAAPGVGVGPSAGPAATNVGAAPAIGTGAAASRSDVRVDLKKLDALINLVGELVVAEAMVTGWVKSKGIEDESLDRAVHHLKRTTLNLQDVAMSVRMVPVNQTFKKMVRLVHDTSTRLNKKVRLNLIGEETEVDKTVIEQIADPLVHCVRNSIDHGLETPEQRLAAGKDEQGTITLEAKHEGGEVWIIIQDDGKGLNKDKILARARERGLFAADKENSLTDTEIFNFIFEPGFSTAEQVTDVSGRGVGMDVVKKNIEKVKGKIRIESWSGTGSRVVFKIPLTLAIIEGMMIRVGASKYTIPLLSIQESIRIPADSITTGPDGLEMIDVRSNFIPIVRLDDLMTKNKLPTKAGDCVVVVVEVNNRSIALLVDEILGQQQTVIKALPAIYRHSKNVSGCSILANGDVSLILDVAGIAQTLNSDYENLMSGAA